MWIVMAGSRKIKVWDTTHQRLLQTFTGHASPVTSLSTVTVGRNHHSRLHEVSISQFYFQCSGSETLNSGSVRQRYGSGFRILLSPRVRKTLNSTDLWLLHDFVSPVTCLSTVTVGRNHHSRVHEEAPISQTYFQCSGSGTLKSGSVRQRYWYGSGFGSFYHQGKKSQKNLEFYWFVTTLWFCISRHLSLHRHCRQESPQSPPWSIHKPVLLSVFRIRNAEFRIR